MTKTIISTRDYDINEKANSVDGTYFIKRGPIFSVSLLTIFNPLVVMYKIFNVYG